MKLESHSISNGTKQYNEPDVVAHPCDPTSQGAEGRIQVQAQPLSYLSKIKQSV